MEYADISEYDLTDGDRAPTNAQMVDEEYERPY
jgi:hypothetical protein